jgi:COMPASS component BRE2
MLALSRDDSPALVAVPNRKRKHPDSPAPDPSSTTETTAVLPAARNDLSSRPRLTISRFPVFPTSSDTSPYHSTEQLAMNRIGFRYTPAGVSPPSSTLPCRTIESTPTSTRVSWEDRSPFVRVTPDGLGLAGDKGFRSARCNVPIREGKWYMEVKIEQGGGEKLGDSTAREGCHVRLGWGRREAPLNGPVGLDGYSYGIRDKTGEKVNLSRPRPYGRPFGSGDVVGMYISLPPRRHADEADPHDPAHIKRERIAIEFKGQEYFESLEYAQSKEMISLMEFSNKPTNKSSVPSSSKKSATVKNLPERGGRTNKSQSQPSTLRPLPTLPNSYIAFFINGECQGIAFKDIYDFLQLRTTPSSRKSGKQRRPREGATLEHKHKENPFDDGSLGYYPFISLFNDARVRLNPGPVFEHLPPHDIDAILSNTQPSSGNSPTWRPLSSRYPEYMAEQWALDASDEEAAKTLAAQNAAIEEAEAAKKAALAKRRAQAEARKKAKKEAATAANNIVAAVATPEDTFTMNEDARCVMGAYGHFRANSSTPRLGSSPAPSPLRFGGGGDLLEVHSPTPTRGSSVDIMLGHGEATQSGYNSEDVDGDLVEDLIREPSVPYPESPPTWNEVQYIDEQSL